MINAIKVLGFGIGLILSGLVGLFFNFASTNLLLVTGSSLAVLAGMLSMYKEYKMNKAAENESE